MKYEWRKSEKELYQPKDIPQIITIKKQKFFTIKGEGNPNSKQFLKKIGVLYTMAYAVRMMPKNKITPEGYFEYTVYPLEGIWDLNENAKMLSSFNKNDLVYKIMIRQPDFVTEEIANKAFEIANNKKPSNYLKDAKFEELEDGLCVQIMHTGSFDSENESFEKMKEFLKQNNLTQRAQAHKEIYLSNFEKTQADKLKTILRYFVTK